MKSLHFETARLATVIFVIKEYAFVSNESLYSVVFELCPKCDVTIPAAMGNQTHALFINLVNRFDAVLSSRLHDEPGYRPFTVSPLCGGKIMGERITLRRGQLCRLRITLLDGGALWKELQKYFREAGPIHVRLGSTDLLLVRMFVSPTTDDLSGVGSVEWQTLVSSPVQATITIYFSTATAFSLGQHQFCLFPEPYLVWGSLLRTWNKYAPEHMHMEKQMIRKSFNKHIAVIACELQHAYLYFPTYVQKGFVGYCTYYLNVDPPLATYLTTLAAFSFYAGIGYKTTMGMGQVRVVFGEMASS